MQLGYINRGVTTAFPVNAAECTSRVMPVMSQSGRPLRYRFRIDVKATLDAEGQSACSTLEEAVRQTLLQPYGSLVLYQDTGLQSATRALTPTSLSGVRIVDGPNFQEASGYEYVTGRTVTFAMEGEYLVPGQANYLTRWQQTIGIIGNGGPRRNWRFPLNAKPVRQVVTPQSLVRVVQQGMAIGHSGKPPPPPYAVDPNFLVNEAVSAFADDPTPIGPGRWVDFPIRWNWVYELAFVPTILPSLPTTF